jgi:hypothetical protein
MSEHHRNAHSSEGIACFRPPCALKFFIISFSLHASGVIIKIINRYEFDKRSLGSSKGLPVILSNSTELKTFLRSNRGTIVDI